MAHDPLFDSAWFKWVGAIAHTQALQQDVVAKGLSGDADPVRAFRTEYDPKRHGFGVVVEELAPMSLRWRLLLGEGLSGLLCEVGVTDQARGAGPERTP